MEVLKLLAKRGELVDLVDKVCVHVCVCVHACVRVSVRACLWTEVGQCHDNTAYSSVSCAQYS